MIILFFSEYDLWYLFYTGMFPSNTTAILFDTFLKLHRVVLELCIWSEKLKSPNSPSPNLQIYKYKVEVQRWLAALPVTPLLVFLRQSSCSCSRSPPQLSGKLEVSRNISWVKMRLICHNKCRETFTEGFLKCLLYATGSQFCFTSRLVILCPYYKYHQK